MGCKIREAPYPRDSGCLYCPRGLGNPHSDFGNSAVAPPGLVVFNLQLSQPPAAMTLSALECRSRVLGAGVGGSFPPISRILVRHDSVQVWEKLFLKEVKKGMGLLLCSWGLLFYMD